MQNDGTVPLNDRLALVEASLIRSFLAARGCDLETVRERAKTDPAAQELLTQASQHASGTMAHQQCHHRHWQAVGGK